MQSKILYRALKLVEEIYDESMYGVDDLYRIKDIVHSVDKNHWESKKWLADKLFFIMGGMSDSLAGKFYVVGGWYGMMAYQLRQLWPWPASWMNIISADCDPMCEEYAWKLFSGEHLQFITIDVNDEPDFNGCTAIINTSCEHMEQEDLLSIIKKKPRDTWVAFQTNDFSNLHSHINCWPTAQLFADSLGLKYIALVDTLPMKDFNRFMVIGK